MGGVPLWELGFPPRAHEDALAFNKSSTVAVACGLCFGGVPLWAIVSEEMGFPPRAHEDVLESLDSICLGGVPLWAIVSEELGFPPVVLAFSKRV